MNARKRYALCLFAVLFSLLSVAQKNVIDEVVWVVGDEAILRSDVEKRRMEYGTQLKGNPYCVIPEQLAIQKLFLHQAVIDSIDVSDADASPYVEEELNKRIMMAGSKEKLEEYMKMPMVQIREEMHDMVKNEMVAMRMREQLMSDIKVTPAEVRRFFKDMPEDSLPLIPTQVEVQILVLQPRIPQTEIDRIKDLLRDYTERVNQGTSSFQTLARLYSEDPGSARQGGELGFAGKGVYATEFENVAFNLHDGEISDVVETQFGFHIIQLIERRGETINCRHILLTAKVPVEALEKAQNQLDSVAQLIRNGDMTFEEACKKYSDDDSRNNGGYLSNAATGGNWLSLQDLQELEQGYPEYKNLAFVISRLEVGQISDPVPMTTNENNDAFRLVKVNRKNEAHQANLKDDYSLIQNWALGQKRQQAIGKWVANKAAKAYIRLDDAYKDYDFYYDWNFQ